MSMTKEEAIKQIEKLKSYCEYMADSDESGAYLFDLDRQALNLALSALRPVSRERVEKARWIKIYEDGEPAIEQHQIGVACSKCMNMPKDRFTESKFCPNCGHPMTDEAVDMVMERLEAMYEET